MLAFAQATCHVADAVHCEPCSPALGAQGIGSLPSLHMMRTFYPPPPPPRSGLHAAPSLNGLVKPSCRAYRLAAHASQGR